MSHDIVLRNGLVVTPSGVIEGGVAINDEMIAEVGPTPSLGSGRREIDLGGKIVFPGLFDPHIHFGGGDKTGQESMREDFRHDTKDCLIGGVTTIATTTVIGKEPLTDLFDRALESGENSWCDFKVTCTVNTRDQINQIPAIAAKSGVSFKFFTGYVGQQAEGFGIDPRGCTPDFFYLACEALARCGPPTFAKIHAEDPYVRGILVDRLRQLGRHDKLIAWAESSPDWAESLQVYTYGLIANELNVPLYPVHISSAHTVETVKALHGQGFKVIGETLALFLSTTATEMESKGLGAKAKIQPPIRFEHDKERLWQGIREGTISIVGTDSITYSASFKESEDFWECRAGVNLQVADTLPLLFDEANRRRIDLHTLAQILSGNAAKTYGIYPRKGAIATGSDADLVVVDPDKEVVLGTGRYRSRSDYSLWEGRVVKGAPVMTFLRGNLVMENGEISAPRPTGRFVPQVIRPRGLGFRPSATSAAERSLRGQSSER